MQVFTEILGNAHSPEWKEKLASAEIENLFLDQWTAQKSRFLAKSDKGTEYAVALKRHSQIVDGDIVAFDPETNTAVLLRLNLSEVLVIDLGHLAGRTPEDIIRISVELGHAIGNQHWPAVVKGTKVYVPLTVDKKVMMSVLETHHIEDITFDFHPGLETIPFLAPAEMRRLFGGAGQESHSHVHDHDDAHCHCVSENADECHEHEHCHDHDHHGHHHHHDHHHHHGHGHHGHHHDH